MNAQVAAQIGIEVQFDVQGRFKHVTLFFLARLLTPFRITRGNRLMYVCSVFFTKKSYKKFVLYYLPFHSPLYIIFRFSCGQLASLLERMVPNDC